MTFATLAYHTHHTHTTPAVYEYIHIHLFTFLLIYLMFYVCIYININRYIYIYMCLHLPHLSKYRISHFLRQDHQRGLPNIFASLCVNSWGQALSSLDFVEAPVGSSPRRNQCATEKGKKAGFCFVGKNGGLLECGQNGWFKVENPIEMDD